MVHFWSILLALLYVLVYCSASPARRLHDRAAAGSAPFPINQTIGGLVQNVSFVATNAPLPSTYIIDGISFEGNPSSLVLGSVTLTAGASLLTASGHIIAIPTSATDGQVQVDGTPFPLSIPETSSSIEIAASSDTTTGTGTGSASSTGTEAGSGIITGSDSISPTSYIASNVPTGTPWGVMLTTVSGESYTLTWVGTQINTPTTIIQTGLSTTETSSQTAGGFIWTVPTLPPGFPNPIPPRPPPGFPKPKLGGGVDPVVPGCIFGCGTSGGGGGGFPCLIDCGGGDGEPSPTDSKPTDQTNSPTNTKATESQTATSESTESTLSCTESSVFPSCTQLVSVSVYVTSGSTSTTTTTSTSCTTITGCTGTATTEASTKTTSSAATADVCGPSCGDSVCAAATGPAKSKRDKPLNMGRLATPEDYLRDTIDKRGFLSVQNEDVQGDLSRRGFIDTPDGVDYRGSMTAFISEEITKPGKKPLGQRRVGRLSSALAVAFDSPPNEGEYYPSVSGLEGCTSVVIIGEKGCWISHFWETSFQSSDENFHDQVIHSIEQGDDTKRSPLDDDGTIMPSPFGAGGMATRIPELADGEGKTIFKPQILISTPDVAGDYDARLALIEQALTGPGRAFEGIPVKKEYYTIRRPPDARSQFGKVLIQYTNDQQNDMGERIKCPQTAIYRVWFEDKKMADHEWPAVGNQVSNNNQKRHNQACFPSSSTGSITGTIIGTASTGTINSGIGSPTGPSTTVTACVVSTTTFQPADASFGLTGIGTYCQCGPTIAGLNYAASGTSTTSYCAIGIDPPAGYTQIPADGHGPITPTATAIPIDTASINSVASASSMSSASSAAAEASWSSAAAVPSAGCYITDDDEIEYSSFEVYGINDWAGEHGSKLLKQEKGCGILDFFKFLPDQQSEFNGRMRNTQTARFGLEFFKGGCIERAIASAGGPSPKGGLYEIHCHHHKAALKGRRDVIIRANDTLVENN